MGVLSLLRDLDVVHVLEGTEKHAGSEQISQDSSVLRRCASLKVYPATGRDGHDLVQGLLRSWKC
jgi:hypothetical protein